MLEKTYIRDEKGRITWFNVPTQVKFIDEAWDGDEPEVNYIGGIGYQDKIICGCCGSTESLEELYYDFASIGTEPVIVYDTWLDLSEVILGDESKKGKTYENY